MQFYRLQYVSILENKAFLADLPSKSFLPSFTGKIKFTGHLPVNRWSGKISQITTLVNCEGWTKRIIPWNSANVRALEVDPGPGTSW